MTGNKIMKEKLVEVSKSSHINGYMQGLINAGEVLIAKAQMVDAPTAIILLELAQELLTKASDKGRGE